MDYLYFKFRLYPTAEQESLLTQHCDAARFVYNILLADNIKQYEETQTFTMGMSLNYKIKELRKNFPWLKDVNSQSLQQSAMNLAQGFKNRFSKKYKKQAGFPKFKSKRNNRQSFSVPQHFSISKDLVKLPKIGWIKFRKHRNFQGKVKSITVIRELDQWYISVLCEYEKQIAEIDYNKSVGIDVGIKTFAVTSDGEVWDLPDLTNETKRLKTLQRRFSKKQKGSNNRNKARIKVAKQYRKFSRIKTNAINNFVATIIKGYDVIAMEDLNISGMKKNRNLAPSIQQLPWGTFRSKVQEKAKHFHLVNRWFPSSKTCSSCGWIKKDLTLGDRTFDCDSCGFNLDRDLNAAINLRTDATSGLACGDYIRPDGINTLRQRSMKQEGQTVRNHESVGVQDIKPSGCDIC